MNAPADAVGVWLPCRCLPRALRHASAHHLCNHTRCARCAPGGAVSRQRDTSGPATVRARWAHSSRRPSPVLRPATRERHARRQSLAARYAHRYAHGQLAPNSLRSVRGSDAAPPPSVARFVPATVPGGTRSQGPKARGVHRPSAAIRCTATDAQNGTESDRT